MPDQGIVVRRSGGPTQRGALGGCEPYAQPVVPGREPVARFLTTATDVLAIIQPCERR